MITKTEKQIAAVFAVLVALAAIAWFTVEPAYGQKPPSPPGQGECGHGNSQKPCKEDPQPDRGKDCEEHGPKEGGVNEDHCKGGTTPPVDPPVDPPKNPDPPKEEPPSTPTTPTETTPVPVEPVAPPSVDQPDSPDSPSTSTPVAPEAEEFQEALEEQVEQQAKSNGATSAPTIQTPATDALPHTGFPAWLAAILGGLLVGTGLVLRRR